MRRQTYYDQKPDKFVYFGENPHGNMKDPYFVTVTGVLPSAFS